MSTENRERILVRLESGKDRQTRGRLRSPDGCMCIQGVIVDEFIKSTGRGAWTPSSGSGRIPFHLDGERKWGWLPYQVEAWSGLSDREITAATDLNDDGVPFPEIAAKLRSGDLDWLRSGDLD